MREVQPIRDKNKIKEMKDALQEQNHRNFILFVLGINTGLRISDLLPLKVRNVRNVTHITLTEQKTDKIKRFLINSQLKEDIDKYIAGMDSNDYLFKSQRGTNRPIDRVQAYRILNKAAREVGLANIGTHTMRKTFGYWHYQTYKDVALLQELFNHSSPSVTLRYIGITQDMMDKTIKTFYL